MYLLQQILNVSSQGKFNVALVIMFSTFSCNTVAVAHSSVHIDSYNWSVKYPSHGFIYI